MSSIENLNGEILGYAENLTLGKSGYYAIIDSNDLVLSHPNKDLIGKEFPFNINHKSFK